MVDMVSHRIVETFNRFSATQTNQTESLSTVSNLKRFSRDLRYKKALSREVELQHRERQLFNIKENVPELQLPRTKYLNGLACEHCSMPSRESFINKTTDKMTLINLLNPPKGNILLNFLCGDILRTSKLKRFSYNLVDERILNHDRVTKAIQLMTNEQCKDFKNADDSFCKKILKSNTARAKKLFKNMRSNLSDRMIKIVVYVLNKVFPCFLRSILIDKGQVDMLIKANQTGLPLVFLPLHKSHLDYLIISYIIATNNIKVPLVAAGDNLKIPFFGNLLRGLGGFFIKRRIDPIQGRKDHIYKALLHTYIAESLKMGNNVEFYLEGGRSRTGKSLMPKYGMFSVLIDSILDESLEDVLLVPISLNYDKLVDGNFCREQLGEAKRMESFFNTIKAMLKVVTGDFGMVKVDLNQPYSLRELLTTFKMSSWNFPNKLSKTSSIGSLYGIDITSDQNKYLVEATCRHILYDANKSSSIMATNMVAFLLLTKYRNGVSMDRLDQDFEDLIKELAYTNKKLGFQGKTKHIINYAITMLGNELVKKTKIKGLHFVQPNISLPKSIELKYYANSLVSHFAMDSIIATSILTVDKSGLVDSSHLLDTTLELSDVLKYEFILCKTCQSLDQIIAYNLDELRIRKQIFVAEKESILDSRSQRIARDLVDEEETFVSKRYQINVDAGAYGILKELREIIYPLLECYFFSALCLKKLVSNTMLENDLVQDIVTDLKKRLNENVLLHSEAISVDTIKNALKLFHSWGYLDCHDEGKLRLYYFTANCDNLDSIQHLLDKIGVYIPTVE